MSALHPSPVLTYQPPCSGPPSIHPMAGGSAISKALIVPPSRTAPRQFTATATSTASRTIRSVIRFRFIGSLCRCSRRPPRNRPLRRRSRRPGARSQVVGDPVREATGERVAQVGEIGVVDDAPHFGVLDQHRDGEVAVSPGASVQLLPQHEFPLVQLAPE